MRRWEQLFWKCERPWLSKRTGHTRNEDAGHLEGKRQARRTPKSRGAPWLCLRQLVEPVWPRLG